MDFRRKPPALPPLTNMDSTVAAVESFRFLGTTISQDLKRDNHIDSTAKKAQQRLYFLCQLRKFNLPQELLKQFYSAIIESVLCSSVTVWFGSATKTDIRRLQRTVRTAERIINAPLPNLQDLYISRVRKRAKKVTLDPSHPVRAVVKSTFVVESKTSQRPGLSSPIQDRVQRGSSPSQVQVQEVRVQVKSKSK